MLAKFALLFVPWHLRRRLLCYFYKYEIHPTAHIGFSWIYPDRLFMGELTSIGHLNVVKGLHVLRMSKSSLINRLNWITGQPLGCNINFANEPGRCPELRLEEHSAITNRHLIDCTNLVHIGRYSIVAGFRSQILTHGIDFEKSAQSSAPVSIGEYCFIGTASVLLKGARIPDYCVVGAMSLVNKSFDEEQSLYAGVPACRIKSVDLSMNWFHRDIGTTF